MAGDDSAKRQKTSQDGVVIAKTVELRGRIQQSSRTGPPPAGPGPAGSHGHDKQPNEGRPSATVTVDLSRVDTSVVAHISSFLGTSLELRNLALTCKSFGWRLPTSTLNWSLVEEVARQAVCSRASDDEISRLPRYVSGKMTWLSILYRFERPLVFDVLLGGDIEYRHGDESTVCGTGKCCIAVSSGYVMRSGSHYAQFKFISGEPFIGIVRPMPGLDAGAYNDSCRFVGIRRFYSDFLAQRSDDWGNGNVHAFEYQSIDGYAHWTDWDLEAEEEEEDERWAHWEGIDTCGSGDTVGMLLNLDNGTLNVYQNNRHLGEMEDGLSGPYCWYGLVDVNDVVAIRQALPPGFNK